MSQHPVSAPTHRLVPSPAGRLHVVEQGSGPLVLLVHGFPESWYSWRHQLPVLAAAGYRAVAVDVRGYGRSSRPAATDAYRMTELVADNVAVVHALGERTAVVVGHDWGSNVAATSALLRPDVFRAVGMLSVPYAPPGGPRPSTVFASMGGDEEFYVSYFQEPGRAEAEIEPDVRGWLAGFYTALSGDTEPAADAPDPHFVTPGGTLRDRFPAHRLPGWLSEADLDVYAGEFERTGLTGALARYRNMDRDWEDLSGHEGAPVTQPSLFVGGALDASTTWMADAIDAFPVTLPALGGLHILDGCGHWLQQERPAETNRILTDWLEGLPGPAC
ncbi:MULTISPECIES: alpha/beta fold hydrolase [Streptomyces]|jgi:pimeloyl-ACP methyl ester carboxylesterase|uniref:Epoxide hydrolase n=2 Tax=Streptomyces TaxID=1883 RepID=A0A514JJI5_9ACTN|nr:MULTISPECIES: alpha/beta hydrolase [Streptomyces]MBA8944190.1 pimeloyl-ACP methyl ester carboxylesterase [Streptomyces calvus]MBA8976547.1 pimeloyl-ACP methyl ester carboxylesterase [Streptomyces calvus]MYS27686.1 alpha/beta fold hydrolase [Streptomyces sp. SID7804]QDI67483.1 epoxide hydrolase [Streptomyces calvus]GGP53876.1 epoxide hydrolase [Streptomyces calvus]